MWPLSPPGAMDTHVGWLHPDKASIVRQKTTIKTTKKKNNNIQAIKLTSKTLSNPNPPPKKKKKNCLPPRFDDRCQALAHWMPRHWGPSILRQKWGKDMVPWPGSSFSPIFLCFSCCFDLFCLFFGFDLFCFLVVMICFVHFFLCITVYLFFCVQWIWMGFLCLTDLR